MRRVLLALTTAFLSASLCACNSNVGLPSHATSVGPTLRVLSLGEASNSVKIYVTNSGPTTTGGSVASYAISGGKPDRLVTTGLDYPAGVAVDKHGKIYVTNYMSNSLFTYDASGKQTTPTITTGLDRPVGVAVDKSGKIYVANQAGDPYNAGYIATFKSDGSPAPGGLFQFLSKIAPWGIAVDAKGKIYVSSLATGNVYIYNAKGASVGRITVGTSLTGIAVDAHGNIYVIDNATNTLKTYTPALKQTTPTITKGLDNPQGVAVGANGDIYVVNYKSNTLVTYTSTGKKTTPTIRHLHNPIAITLH